LAFGDSLKGDDVNAQELITVSNILAVNAFEEIRNWLPMPGVDGEVMIVGSRGYAQRYLYPEYAKIRAELIVEEQLRSAKTENGGNNKNGEDLPPLEWRKQVDRTLENVEYTRNCHNDRFFRDEKQLQDHDYRIQAWGVCLSDALKKIIAQDERIAKLEAKLDEFENVATVDEVVGRVSDLERRLDAVNGMNVTAHGVIDQQHDKFRSRLDRLESQMFSAGTRVTRLESVGDATAEAIEDTIECATFHALEKNVDVLAKRMAIAERRIAVALMPLAH
jgi:hypothetical protein